jgi:hypothetical protein
MSFRRALAVTVAIVGAGIVLSSWSSQSSRSTASGVSDPASTTIAVNDVHVAAPAGWGSEAFVNSSGMSILRLGSFEFRHAADDDVGQTAQGSMGATDVLINIVDVTPTDAGEGNSYYRSVALPLTVDDSQAVHQEGYTAPAAVIRGVRINGHNLYVSVAFGSAPPSAAQIAEANAVLRTLAVP